MSPAKHAAICAEIQQLHQAREKKLLARIAELEAHRKPLTQQQIVDLCDGTLTTWEQVRIARAIESAHGIKGDA